MKRDHEASQDRGASTAGRGRASDVTKGKMDACASSWAMSRELTSRGIRIVCRHQK